MAWMMPHEGTPHERTWMAFPREGETLGKGAAWQDTAYRAWSSTALAIAEFEPVTMVVDPTEIARARKLLGTAVDIVELPLDEFWMRDFGPTFVTDPQHPGRLGAVDWIFNGWGAASWAEWTHSAKVARAIAEHVRAEHIPSLLVNEGGGIHVDGAGTVLLTETVQLDPNRNPFADKQRVEEEMQRTIGAEKAIWLPCGLTRDYDEFGTRGHVDIVAAFAGEGRVLLHDQPDPAHPDYEVTRSLKRQLEAETDTNGSKLEIIDVAAPATLRDDDGFVDWSYINHLVVNDGVVACGFGEEDADARARSILADAYPGRRVVTVDARPIFARGGGIHCITQQQPRVQGV